MSIRAWFRERRPLTLIIVMTLAFTVLVVMGWRLDHEDSPFGDVRVAAGHERATDPPVAALEAVVSATEQILRDPEAMRFAAVTPDSVTVTFDDTHLEALPHGRLLYYPLVSGPGLPDFPPAPRELTDRSARCSLLADQQRKGELKGEALELRELLLDGRWRLTRSVFEVYLRSASEWAQAGEPPAAYRLALSAAVARLWYSRASAETTAKAPGERWAGRRLRMAVAGVPLTLLVQTDGTRTNALIAGPAYVQQEWNAKITTLRQRDARSP